MVDSWSVFHCQRRGLELYTEFPKSVFYMYGFKNSEYFPELLRYKCGAYPTLGSRSVVKYKTWSYF